jgi:hypothetical protein
MGKNQLVSRARLRVASWDRLDHPRWVTALLGRDFAALPNNNLGKPTPGFLAVNVALDLLEGISIVWLYAAIRPLYRPGAKTAVIAAFAWWFIVSFGDVTWCSFGFFPPNTVIPLMIGTLPALIVSTLAGCQVLQGINSCAVRFSFSRNLGKSEKVRPRAGSLWVYSIARITLQPSCITAWQRRQVYSQSLGLLLRFDILHTCFVKKQMIRFTLPCASTRIRTIAPRFGGGACLSALSRARCRCVSTLHERPVFGGCRVCHRTR